MEETNIERLEIFYSIKDKTWIDFHRNYILSCTKWMEYKMRNSGSGQDRFQTLSLMKFKTSKPDLEHIEIT